MFYHLRIRSLVDLKVSHMVKINFSLNFRHHDCIFLDSLVIFKHCLDLYLGYVASQSAFLYMKQLKRKKVEKFFVTFILG